MNDQRLMGISSALKGLKTRLERMEEQHSEMKNTLHRTEQILLDALVAIKDRNLSIRVRVDSDTDEYLVRDIIDKAISNAKLDNVAMIQ